MSQVTLPGLITSPVLRFTFPRAAVRDITRPAPCTVEYSDARCRSESCRAPSMITALSPIEPPTNPCCPGNAGVAPLRTTTYSVPSGLSYLGRERAARQAVSLLGRRELELVHNHQTFAW